VTWLRRSVVQSTHDRTHATPPVALSGAGGVALGGVRLSVSWLPRALSVESQSLTLNRENDMKIIESGYGDGVLDSSKIR
jgi:hypothetical protein